MKSGSAALLTYLQSLASGGGNVNPLLMCELFAFTLVNGVQAYYTTVPGTLMIGSTVYDGSSVILTRGKTRTVLGAQVATMDLTVAALPTHTIDGIPWLEALDSGLFDMATLVCDRYYFGVPGDFISTGVYQGLGRMNKFTGRVGNADIGRFSAQVRIDSMMSICNILYPRHLFMPYCRWTLFGDGCGLSPAGFSVAGHVTGGASTTAITTNLTQGTLSYDMGTVTFTSGALDGESFTVKQATGASGAVTLSFIYPLPAAPAIGDTIIAYPGCALTMASCSAFGNLANFGGSPFVPNPNTVV